MNLNYKIQELIYTISLLFLISVRNYFGVMIILALGFL